MEFRIGTFERDKLRCLRRFCPTRAVISVLDVDAGLIKSAGKRLVLLDIDHTLLPWRSEDIPQSTVEWVAKARAAGLNLCILSNTRRVERLERITQKLGIDYIRDRFKPHPTMYLMALERYQCKAEEALMVGDQLFTDVWGANRTGIDAIWVKPIARREFFGTKVSRFGEWIIRPWLYRVLKGDN